MSIIKHEMKWKSIYFFIPWIIMFSFFFLLILKIRIPIYSSTEGYIVSKCEDCVLHIQCEDRMPEKIYYFLNRDEWINVAEREKGIGNDYIFENNHVLEPGIIVMVDYQTNEISLFEAIVRYGGNIWDD